MYELLARVRNLSKPSNSWELGYDEGYKKGLREGQDFGERVAHNRTLVAELPRILSRYSQLQIKIMNKKPAEIKKQLGEFQDKEIERLRMDMQDR